MKTSFLILLAFVLSGTFGYAQRVDHNHELLWEIKAPSGQTSYLFGSLHSNDKRLFNLSDSVYWALDRSSTIILEADIFSIFETLDTRRDNVAIEFDNEGNPYTKSPEATTTSYGDENGMPQFLDAFFEQYCFNAGKNFEALESVEFQKGLLQDVDWRPSFDQVNYESLIASKEDMVDLYLKGDIHELNNFVKNGMSLFPDVYEEVIVARNKNMAIGLDSLMQGKTFFCAIGAGHLAGPKGVLNLMRAKGYSVRKVVASYSETSTPAENRVKQAKTITITDAESGFKFTFPGKPVEIEDEYEDYLRKFLYRELGQGNSYEVELYARTSQEDWSDLAAQFIPSLEGSDYEQITLSNGGEAIQGLGQEYWDYSVQWIRVLMGEEYIIVLKAYGGNKFMNSPRAFRFFDSVVNE